MLEFRFGSLKASTVSPFLLDEILRKKVFQSFRKHVGRDRVVDFGPSLKNMPIIVLKEKNLRCCFTPSALVQLKIVIQKIPENWVFELKICQNYRLRNPLNQTGVEKEFIILPLGTAVGLQRQVPCHQSDVYTNFQNFEPWQKVILFSRVEGGRDITKQPPPSIPPPPTPFMILRFL